MLRHLLGAGLQDRALVHARQAAENAERALAFDHAADLYGRCLALSGGDAPDRLALLLRQSECLANAGRGPEAAEAYTQAADLSSPDQAWRLRGQAAQALLGCGHLERGKALLKQVLRAMGLSTPGSGAGAVASFLAQRARLSLRGLEFQEQPAQEIAPALTDRIDACSIAAMGLGLADPVEGAVYQTRALRMSLDAGEPARTCRALAMEAAYAAIGGAKGRDRMEHLLARARQLAEGRGDRHLDAAVDIAEAIARFQLGGWRTCHDLSVRARQTLRALRLRGQWELDTAETYVLAGLGFLGQLEQALDQFTRLLEDARRLGDLHLATHARLGMEFNAFLILDRPDEAERDVREALDQWPIKKGFTLQHVYASRALAQIALYRGDAAGGLELAEAAFRKLNRSGLRSVGIVLALNREQQGRARLAVAAMARSGAQARLVKRALADARGLDRFGLHWTTAAATLLRAQASAVRGDDRAAASSFGRAADQYEALEMATHAAAACWGKAALSGDTMGVQAARDRLADLGARNPEAVAAMVAPVAGQGRQEHEVKDVH